MKSLRRTNVGEIVRHPLSRYPGVVALLRVPTNSEMLLWFDGSANAHILAVTNCVVGLEGHPEADAFGAAGTPERRAFVEAMDPTEVVELGKALDALGAITEVEAKN